MRRASMWNGSTADGGRWQIVRADPHPQLAGDVQGYCGYREAGAPLQRREVPSGGAVLIISFGDELALREQAGGPAGDPAVTRTVRSFVASFHDRHTLVGHGGRQHGLQVNLTPLGARRLLALPMRETANRSLPLEALLPQREVAALADRLACQPGWAARFALLDRLLLRWQDTGPPPDPGVAWAWRQLTRSAGRAPVMALADELGWSHRHFLSRFRDEVGLGPKRTARVLRFRHAATLLRDASHLTITDVAATCGYADHSHLAREVRALAGCAPSALRPAR